MRIHQQSLTKRSFNFNITPSYRNTCGLDNNNRSACVKAVLNMSDKLGFLGEKNKKGFILRSGATSNNRFVILMTFEPN
jgi:hypothetical protein